jgi:hypothetical protein
MKQKLKQTKAYLLDVSQTDLDGAFSCPHCGSRISPDDHSEDNYTVYETQMTDNNLDELVICCKGCLSFIHLTGFSSVQKTVKLMKTPY